MRHNFKNLAGKKFGRLTVVERIIGTKRTTWHCICDCGKEVNVLSTNLLRYHSTSCGCLLREVAKKRSTTHGLSNSERLYGIWTGIRKRCFCETSIDYKNYGGRGISMCAEWEKNYLNFRDWAMQNGYAENLTIDRIDVNGNYCPENCRWATKKEQVYNKRNTVRISGKSLAKLCDEMKPNDKKFYHKVYMRIKRGWSVEKALILENFK